MANVISGIRTQTRQRKTNFKGVKTFKDMSVALDGLRKVMNDDLGDFFEEAVAKNILDPQTRKRFKEGGIETSTSHIVDLWKPLSLFTVLKRIEKHEGLSRQEIKQKYGIVQYKGGKANVRPGNRIRHLGGSKDSTGIQAGPWMGDGLRDHQPILRDFGKLRKSLGVIRRGRKKAGRRILEYGVHNLSAATYGTGLQDGFLNVPPRKFNVITPYVEKEITLAASLLLDKILEQA